MTTDNRTNELTLEQVEAAFEEGMDAIDWGMVRNGEGDPQEAAGIAVRAALVAAQGAAPQAVTREQILEVVAPFMHDEFVQGQECPADEECADAILALLNGDADD